ncbi:hypothetical protein BCEN4_1010011 [Burkholderia cenocepacia]|nr:hypothetical protein BCEN4_1010011 [Burkholderia cenocepacia]
MLKRGRVDAGHIGIHRAEKHVRASLKQVLRSSRQHYIRCGVGPGRPHDTRGVAAAPPDGDTLA